MSAELATIQNNVVPTNTERMQAYRACMPVQFGNAVFTDRYAFDAAPGDDYEDDLREGFALKYMEPVREHARRQLHP